MALIATLKDNFDDNSINGTLWSTPTAGAVTINETTNAAVFSTPKFGTGADTGYYLSNSTYDLTGSQTFIQLQYAPFQAAVNTIFGLFDTSNIVQLSFNQSSGFLIITYIWGSGFSQNSQTFLNYDSAVHKWFRIRESSGTIYWDTSVDGTTWTNQKSYAVQGSISALKAKFGLESSTSVPNNSVAIFDNFNQIRTAYNFNVTTTTVGGAVTVKEVDRYTVDGGGSGTILATYASIFQQLPQKDYEYRVFTNTGSYLTTWSSEVVSDFGYTQALNQNASEINVRLARNPDNRAVTFDTLLDHNSASILDQNSSPIQVQTTTANAVGPGTDVVENYRVDVYTFYGGYDQLLDSNGAPILDQTGDPIISQFGFPNGKRVYSGYIADYELTYGEQTGVVVRVVPHATEMSHYIFKSGTATTVAKNSTDPVQMARDAMTNYIAQGGVISYDTTTMPLSGTVSSYEFKLQTTREVIDKAIDLLPTGYYHYVDPGENMQYLLTKAATPHHIFYYEKHITELKLRKSITQMVNKIYFIGGDTGGGTDLYKYYEDTTSISTYRAGLDRISDSRVTLDASADIIAQSKINDFKDPKYRTTVTISDAVYDIENIRLGQMVGFKNFGTFADNLVLQIVNLTKKKHTIDLDLDMIVDSDTKRIEDIKRNLESQEIKDIGSVPT
jgi:hypothetical protein